MIKYCSCHTWLNTQLGKYAVSLIQYQMCLATLVSSQRSCKFKRPCRLLKGLRYCCITKHRIVRTQTSTEESYSVKEGVSTISHQQVPLCGYTLFDHVTSQGMYQHKRIGDENSKIISWYLTGLTFLKQLMLWKISSNVLVSRKRVVEDDASVCNLSCFVQNFVFARDNVNGNRHDLICQCLKYTFCSVNYIFWSVNYVLWSVN